MTPMARLYQVDVLLIDLNAGVLKHKSKNKVQEWPRCQNMRIKFTFRMLSVS